MKSLIVARYNEDLSWINRLKYRTTDKIWIYNKGGQLPITMFDEEIRPLIQIEQLPNIGREAHTYLHHIIKHYSDLSELNIFTQGNPADHVKDFNDFNTDWDSYHSLVDYHGNMIQGEPIAKDGSYWMAFKYKSEVTPKSLYETLIWKKPMPENVWTSVCAIFAVPNKQIIQHDISVYKELMRLFERFDSQWMPYVIEYLWSFVFNENGTDVSCIRSNNTLSM
jgi:hypothetical protein